MQIAQLEIQGLGLGCDPLRHGIRHREVSFVGVGHKLGRIFNCDSVDY